MFVLWQCIIVKQILIFSGFPVAVTLYLSPDEASS